MELSLSKLINLDMNSSNSKEGFLKLSKYDKLKSHKDKLRVENKKWTIELAQAKKGRNFGQWEVPKWTIDARQNKLKV